MEFTLFKTIKENFFGVMIGWGIIYGILFGIIVGLILITDLEEPYYTQDAHTTMFYVSISGLSVLGTCIALITKSIIDNGIGET